MNDYTNYELEDFLGDEFFIEWVLMPTSAHHLFWNAWISEHPAREAVLNRARTMVASIQRKPAGVQLSDEEVSKIADYFHSHTAEELVSERNPFFVRYRKWFAVAALVLLIPFSALIYTEFFQKETAVTAAGQQELVKLNNNGTRARLVRLSDGTLVVLSPKSQLSYPKVFSGSKREVFMTGAAFFDVHKDPSHPFMVHSGDVVTKVLGTSFKIVAFPGDGGFKVTVNSGSVEVYKEDDVHGQQVNSSLVLLPDQQAVVNPVSSQLVKDTVRIPLMLSPRIAVKRFSFTNTPVSVIVSRLEEAYGVRIAYDHEQYANATVTASLSKLPLEEKIKAICTAIDAGYEFTDDGIRIY